MDESQDNPHSNSKLSGFHDNKSSRSQSPSPFEPNHRPSRPDSQKSQKSHRSSHALIKPPDNEPKSDQNANPTPQHKKLPKPQNLDLDVQDELQKTPKTPKEYSGPRQKLPIQEQNQAENNKTNELKEKSEKQIDSKNQSKNESDREVIGQNNISTPKEHHQNEAPSANDNQKPDKSKTKKKKTLELKDDEGSKTRSSPKNTPIISPKSTKNLKPSKISKNNDIAGSSKPKKPEKAENENKESKKVVPETSKIQPKQSEANKSLSKILNNVSVSDHTSLDHRSNVTDNSVVSKPEHQKAETARVTTQDLPKESTVRENTEPDPETKPINSSSDPQNQAMPTPKTKKIIKIIKKNERSPDPPELKQSDSPNVKRHTHKMIPRKALPKKLGGSTLGVTLEEYAHVPNRTFELLNQKSVGPQSSLDEPSSTRRLDKLEKSLRQEIHDSNEIFKHTKPRDMETTKKYLPVTKWNYEERFEDSRRQELDRQRNEIIDKIENLRVSGVLESHKTIEKLKLDLEHLEQILIELSPEVKRSKKSKPRLSQSDIHEAVYSEEKQLEAQAFIEYMQNEQKEADIKIIKKMEKAAQLKEEELDHIKLEYEIYQAKQRLKRKLELNETLEEMEYRRQHRRQLAQWERKLIEELCSHKPLFKIKEEEFRQAQETDREIKEEALEKRLDIFKPPPDYQFMDWRKSYEDKKSETLSILERKRNQFNQEIHDNAKSLYQSHFHYMVKHEQEVNRAMQVLKEAKTRELYQKKLDYDDNVRKNIKVSVTNSTERESRKPTKTEMKMLKARSQQVLSQKELYRLGNNYLDAIKKKKSVGKLLESQLLRSTVDERPVENPEEKNEPRDDSQNRSQKNDDDRGEVLIKSPKSLGVSIIEPRTNVRGSNNSSLPPIVSRKKERDSPSPTKQVNYLPELREYLKRKKKVGELEGILTKGMPDADKYTLVKAGIKKLEQNAKFMEKKMKYGKDKNQMESDKASLDNMYMDSIKAKIAILNGFA